MDRFVREPPTVDVNMPLARFVVHGGQPMSLVENASFRSFMAEAGAAAGVKFKTVSRRQVTRIVDFVLKEDYNKVTDEIARGMTGTMINVCFDYGSTAGAGTPLLGATATCITPEWTIAEWSIGCTFRPESHTASNTSQWMIDSLNGIRVPLYRVRSAIHDSGANMDALSFENETTMEVYCAAHAICTALKHVVDVPAELKKPVSKKKST
jgi:hypothetical protein